MTFKRISSLKAHVTKNHDSRIASAGVTLKCIVCSDLTSSLPHMLRHLRRHATLKELVRCPFQECNFKGNVATTFSAHISRKHRNASITDVQTQLVIGQPSSECDHHSQSTVDDSDGDDNYGNAECTWSSGERIVSSEELLENELARLFLKMHVLLHVPRYAVQEIINGVNHVHLLSKPLLKQKILEVLAEHHIGLHLVDMVTDCLLNEHPFWKFTQSSLGSIKMRESFFRNEFPYVEPVEYEFGVTDMGKHCKFVYVPILKSIQALLKRSDILSKVMNIPTKAEGIYGSFVDGSAYEKYASDEGLHLHLTLYTDEWETVNPLGTSRKIHKCTAFYWLFTNLESKYRSASHIVQLACMGRYKDVKQFGYDKYLYPLLRDLSFLETTGVYIEALGDSIRGSVTAVVADNLAAHAIGGFLESFGPNVKYPCRFCTASSDDIQNINASVSDFARRCPLEHNLHVKTLNENPSADSVFGVKKDCELHKYLNDFHATTSLPPDISHDLLEGIVPAELAMCLDVFLQKQYFGLHWLNTAIKLFPYKFKDAVNRPQSIPENFAATGTVGGNASENWTLLRLLPLIVGHKVPADDLVWQLIMDLKDIVELCFAPIISEHCIGYLAMKISDHKLTYRQLFADKKFKPKHHFVEHYPDLIREYGPLGGMWTMRFEAKHSYFKRVVNESHCFKNLFMTLAQKHQLMIAYHLSSPTYFTPEVSVPEASCISINILKAEYQEAIAAVAGTAGAVSVLSNAVVSGMKYCAGMIVVTGCQDGFPEVAEIMDIMLVSDTLYLVLMDMQSWYNEHIRGYFIERKSCVRLLQPSQLYDYYPLTPYCYGTERCIVLKHFIFSPW